MKAFEKINDMELDRVAGGVFRRKRSDDVKINNLVFNNKTDITASDLVFRGKPVNPTSLVYRTTPQKKNVISM